MNAYKNQKKMDVAKVSNYVTNIDVTYLKF